MNDQLVSVITPVYNMEELLPKCIDSILSQTYSHIELVLVDDGSTDRSSQICDDAVERDKRVKVVHQPNKGIAGAINSGLDNSNGDFILFVDSDDYIAPQMIQRLIEIQKEKNYDIVQCHRFSFPLKTGIPIVEQKTKPAITYDSRIQILDDFFHYRRISRNLAARLFKASLFNGVRCEEGKNAIDEITLPQLLNKCSNYAFLDERYYYVYECPTSMNRKSFSLVKWEETKFCNEFMKRFINDNCPEFSEYLLFRYCHTTRFSYCKSIRSKMDALERATICKEAEAIFAQYFIDFRNTRYFDGLKKSDKSSFKRFNCSPIFEAYLTMVRTFIIESLRTVKWRLTTSY